MTFPIFPLYPLIVFFVSSLISHAVMNQPRNIKCIIWWDITTVFSSATVMKYEDKPYQLKAVARCAVNNILPKKLCKLKMVVCTSKLCNNVYINTCISTVYIVLLLDQCSVLSLLEIQLWMHEFLIFLTLSALLVRYLKSEFVPSLVLSNWLFQHFNQLVVASFSSKIYWQYTYFARLTYPKKGKFVSFCLQVVMKKVLHTSVDSWFNMIMPHFVTMILLSDYYMFSFFFL